MADAVKIMSRKDSLIQIETANVQKLTDALGNLLVKNLDLIFFLKTKFFDFFILRKCKIFLMII